jgi:hypothetical protein
MFDLRLEGTPLSAASSTGRAAVRLVCSLPARGYVRTDYPTGGAGMFWRKKRHEEALRHTKGNEDEVLKSDQCGCLGCGATFPAKEVVQWIDQPDVEHHEKRIDRTAVCPHCGEAMILGDYGGYKINRSFLEAMVRR